SFALARVFVRASGDPRVMKACARYGLPRPTLMKLVLKLMANLYEPARGDTTDRIVRALVRLAPWGGATCPPKFASSPEAAIGWPRRRRPHARAVLEAAREPRCLRSDPGHARAGRRVRGAV